LEICIQLMEGLLEVGVLLLKMDLYMNQINKYILLCILVVLHFGAAFFYSKYILRKAVKLAIEKLIIPYLEKKQFKYCNFTLLPNQYFGICKRKGDWKNVPIFKLFDDTRYNRKLYGKLRYKSMDGRGDFFTTVKISLNGQSQPIEFDCYPGI